MEFRQLRYFVATAEEGNMATAAQRLNVSQPPVSRQIQALEEELGAQLFVRTTKGVKLTDAGAMFLEDARCILSRSRRSKGRCQAAHRGELGTLHVGFIGSSICHYIPLALRRFRHALPQAEISLSRLNEAQQIEGLKEGAIHIGFGRYFSDETGIALRAVLREPLFLATMAERPGPSGRPIEMAELKHKRLILYPKGDRPSFTDEVLALLKDRRIQPHIDHIAESAVAALALTAIGVGDCIVPASLAATHWPGVKFIPLAEDMAASTIVCAYSSEDQAPILQRFLATIGKDDDLTH